MAFFDNLGDKIGRAGKTAFGRAKNAAETGNLKMQIAGAQKEEAKAFEALGRKFFELYPDSADEGLQEVLGLIKGAQEKIAELEKGIAESRKLMEEAEAQMAEEAARQAAEAEEARKQKEEALASGAYQQAQAAKQAEKEAADAFTEVQE